MVIPRPLRKKFYIVPDYRNLLPQLAGRRKTLLHYVGSAARRLFC
jgi:hypothetical protein